jgi:sulfur carrier protein
MNIRLNNKDAQLDGPEITVKELLERMKFTFPLVFVKINGAVIKKDAYQRTVIREGDRVEAIHLMGGG